MLDHARATGRREEARARRQIEAAGTVSAGANRVDRGCTFRNDRVHGQFTHGCGEAANFVSRLALCSQAGEQGAGKGRWQFAFRQFVHQGIGLPFGERDTVQQRVQECAVFPAHLLCIRMKFVISVSPSGVSTLSGWNCTPSSCSVLWRTPMITPLSVSAVISSVSGNDSTSAHSE